MGGITDYGRIEDCFAKTRHVASTLLYGDPSAVADPWLTVFIPTYRRADLLQQALDSVLKQWHTDFTWDIVVVDNEPYDGKANAAERLIRLIDNPRVLYYRNSENMRPGDNFNRGILLARGKWVMMLHDDDLLISNTLLKAEKLIEAYSKIGHKPLGAISAAYIQFTYNPEKNLVKENLCELNTHFTSLPVCYQMHRITNRELWFTGHMGGFAPSNGSVYNRSAVLEFGGFNEELGIFCDLILFYNMRKKYSIYRTIVPLGFYRWGSNVSINQGTTVKFVKESMEFREYVYSKNLLTKILGRFFRKCHYQKFTTDVIKDKNKASKERLKLEDFDYIFNRRPSLVSYLIFTLLQHFYGRIKWKETVRVEKKIVKRMKNEGNL